MIRTFLTTTSNDGLIPHASVIPISICITRIDRCLSEGCFKILCSLVDSNMEIEIVIERLTHHRSRGGYEPSY